MNFYRFVAVAAAGWYVIAPSFNEQKHWQSNLTALLSYWAVLHSFDTAKDCEDFRTEMQSKLGEASTAPPGNAHEAVEAGERYAQYISSDDPRLRDR